MPSADSVEAVAHAIAGSDERSGEQKFPEGRTSKGFGGTSLADMTPRYASESSATILTSGAQRTIVAAQVFRKFSSVYSHMLKIHLLGLLQRRPVPVRARPLDSAPRRTSYICLC
jgi:hypothetical protein